MEFLVRVMIAVLVFALTGSALAQDDDRWVRVDRTEQLALYVDSFRIDRLPDGQDGVWTRWDFAVEQALVDKKFDRMIARFVVDCPNVRLMQTEATFYKGGEFMVHVDQPEPTRRWVGPTPQSVNETLAVRSCLISTGQPTATVK